MNFCDKCEKGTHYTLEPLENYCKECAPDAYLTSKPKYDATIAWPTTKKTN